MLARLNRGKRDKIYFSIFMANIWILFNNSTKEENTFAIYDNRGITVELHQNIRNTFVFFLLKIYIYIYVVINTQTKQ